MHIIDSNLKQQYLNSNNYILRFFEEKFGQYIYFSSSRYENFYFIKRRNLHKFLFCKPVTFFPFQGCRIRFFNRYILWFIAVCFLLYEVVQLGSLKTISNFKIYLADLKTVSLIFFLVILFSFSFPLFFFMLIVAYYKN